VAVFKDVPVTEEVALAELVSIDVPVTEEVALAELVCVGPLEYVELDIDVCVLVRLLVLVLNEVGVLDEVGEDGAIATPRNSTPALAIASSCPLFFHVNVL